MSSEKSAEVISSPPAYVITDPTAYPRSASSGSSKKSKALFGYAVAATTALIVVLVMGGVYYYRSMDVLLESIKKFRVSDNAGHNIYQDVEIDIANNYAVFRLTGNNTAPGTFAVMDYPKSMFGIYDPGRRKCFLHAGIKSTMDDAQTLSDFYSNQGTCNTTRTYYYKLADDYPVSDKTILPTLLKSVCNSIPVYWLEETSYLPHDRQKRGSPSYTEFSAGCTNNCGYCPPSADY